MKVETFAFSSMEALEKEVNKFIEDILVTEIKFDSCYDPTIEQIVYSTMILYKT